MQMDDTLRPEGTAPENEADQQQQAPTPPEATTSEIEDVDTIELREAMAAAEAEKAEPGPTQENQSQEDAKANQQEAPEKREPVPAIPKPRFDEVNSELAEARRKLAYAEGRIAAMESKPSPDPSPQEPQQEQENPLAAINNQIRALARRFDDGEISAAELEEQRQVLDDQRQAIREQQLLAKIQPPKAAPSLADEAFLQDRSRRIAEEHPYAEEIPDDKFQHLVRLATQELGENWQNMPSGAHKTLALREKVGELSDVFGPGWVGQLNKPTAPQQQPLSPQAQARNAKLDVAARMPPDISNLTGTSPAGVPSGDALETMSDEEIIAAMPASSRQAIFEGRN